MNDQLSSVIKTIKRALNRSFKRLLMVPSVIRAYRFLGVWLSKSRWFLVLAPLFIFLHSVIGDWITELSLFVFADIKQEQLFGLVNSYEQHPLNPHFSALLWIAFYALFIILIYRDLESNYEDSQRKSQNIAQTLIDELPQLVHLPEAFVAQKRKALSYLTDSDLRKAVLEKQTQTASSSLTSTQVMRADNEHIASQTCNSEERYTTVKELGRGAMGVVYQAKDNVLDRTVALKSMSEQLSAKRQFGERFNREAKMIARLNHPGIVQIYDYFEIGGHYAIAMEYVEGHSLEDVIDANTLPLPIRRNIAIQIAEAMSFAHEQGVIHRDLKPANVLITNDKRIKLTDFGLAKLSGTNETQVGVVLGSPLYMSPEQAKGQQIDHRVDLYAFGILYYQLMTGELPFNGDTSASVIAQQLTQNINFDHSSCKELNAKDRQLIRALTEKEPDKRIQEFTAVIQLLKE